MKLVSTIAYFIKNSQPSFFKPGKPTQTASLFTPNTQTGQKSPKKDVVKQVPNMQMESGDTNIDRAELI